MGNTCCNEPRNVETHLAKLSGSREEREAEVIVEPQGEAAGPFEAKLRKHPQVKLIKSGYMLNQTFAILRHADRLDHTKEWSKYAEAEIWPNDTPLTAVGHQHAARAAQQLKGINANFSMIVCSPYLRCAQTASRVAQVFKLPIHFDLDLGEVFDNEAMRGKIAGKVQHRDPDTLEKELKKDFPDVEYIRDENGKIKIDGHLQKYPEPFEGARMRFCYKTKQLVQKATRELMSILVVTHGDAVAAVTGMVKTSMQTGAVPYTAWASFTRGVKVCEEGSDDFIEDTIVYEPESQWKMHLSPGFTLTPVLGKYYKLQAQKKHKNEMEEMKKQAEEIHTDYDLAPHEVKAIEDTLNDMGASQGEMETIRAMTKKKTVDRLNRVTCAPSNEED